MDYLTPNYQIEQYHEQAKTNLFSSLSFFFVALLCAGFLILKLYQAKKEREKLLAANQEDLLAEKLQAFITEQPSSSHSTYVAEVSRLLRAYLVAKYQMIEYPRGGSGEVFWESIKDKLPAALAPKCRSIFKTIDDIVALELHTVPDIESFRSEVLEIIDSY